MDMTDRSDRLGRLVRRYAPEGGRSGFSLLRSGDEAYLTLHGLAAASRRTLDVQYYLWEDDRSGRRLLAALLDAADRGVRVRMLLDDIGAPRSDPFLARLDGYPNVEVRLFNPFPRRFWTALAGLFRARQLSRRMHNKAFIADRLAAVVGGRNVGDRYFDSAEAWNYRDLDLFAAGPVLEQVSAAFDAFWDSPHSRPIGAIDRGRWRLADVRATVRGVRRSVARDGDGPFPRDLRIRSFRALSRDRFARLVPAEEASVVVDSPNKTETGEPLLLEQLLAKLDGAPARELLVETAYFIPARRGTDLLNRIARSGVTVRALTNSAASTEVAIAYAGYRRYRRGLLAAGVQLHELRPRRVVGPGRYAAGPETKLHTKAAVFDRRDVFVGSLNIDPRSATLNTEIGLLIRSPALAAEVADFIEDGMSPARSCQVILDKGRLGWLDDDGSRAILRRREAGRGWWWWVVARVMALLPIEGQL